jgi:hypothetical protein
MDVLTGELSFKTIDDIHVGSLYSFTIIAEDGVSHREMQEMLISIIEKDLTSPTPTPQNQSLTVNAGSDISAILNQPITLTQLHHPKFQKAILSVFSPTPNNLPAPHLTQVRHVF